MSNWAIVAIPEEDDYVWKISSEKVPHLTLLHLGDQSATDEETLSEMERNIASYLEHVASTAIHSFGLSVDRRGPLGPKDADVLFFDKKYGVPELEAARGFLLIDHAIRDAYNSTDQFRDWTPHLTLGFPETPAKPDERDYPGIHWVNFNRIALWTGDYSGPEFRLESSDDLAMSQQSDEFLAHLEDRGLELMHFGVKGMKWGVRNDHEGLGVSPKTAREARKDAEEFTRAKLFYGEGAGNRRKLIKARVEQKSNDPDYKKAFDHYVGKTDLAKRADQAKGERRRKDVTKSVGKTTRGIKNVVTGNPQAATVAALGIVAGAKALQESGYPQKVAAAISKLAQDRRNHKIVEDLLNNLKHDDLGEDNELGAFLTHSEEFLAYLEANGLEIVHFGTKGMKWGVRKAEPSGGESSSATSDKSGSANSSAAPEKHSQWKKRVAGAENANKVFQEAASTFDPIFKTINNDPSYKGKDLDAPENRSLRSAYDTAVSTAFNQHLAQVSINMTAANTTKGVRAYVFQFDRDRGMMRATEHKQVEHADVTTGPVFKVELDELGQVKSIKFVKGESVQLEHWMTEDEGFLAYLEANGLEIVHFGTKGMKWGVRKAETSGGGGSSAAKEPSRVKSAAKSLYGFGKDVNWNKNAHETSTVLATCLKARKPIKQDVAAINAKPAYSGVKMRKAPKEVQEAYRAEVGAAVAKRMNDAFNEIMPSTSPSGNYSIAWGEAQSPWMSPLVVTYNKPDEVEHAVNPADIPIKAKLTYDDDGFIVDIELIPQVVEHGDEFGLPDDSAFFSHELTDPHGSLYAYLEENGLEIVHFGVKGMKWGVRTRESGGAPKPRGAIRRGATKARTALNAGRGEIDKGEEKLIFLPQKYRNQAASATQTRVLGEAKRLNRDPAYKGKDLKTDPALRDAYHKEIGRRAADIYKEELANARGQAVADAVEAILSPKLDSVSVSQSRSRVRHADDDVLAKFIFVKDDLGQIIDIQIAGSLLEQDDDLINGVALSHIFANEENFTAFLEANDLELIHYGVKGMKWGVRRTSTPSGKGGTPSSDHTDVAALRSKIAAAGGTHVVSNADLRKINDRLNLETNYARLTSEKSSLVSTQDKVKAVLNVGQTVNSAIQFYDSPVGRLLTGRPMKAPKKK